MGKKWRDYRVGKFRLGQLNGEACAVWYEEEDGRQVRRRYRLKVHTEIEGRAALEKFAATTLKAEAKDVTTINELFDAYIDDLERDGKGADRIRWKKKALAPTFGALWVSDISKDLCLRYAKERGKIRKPWTVFGEMSALRSCVNWARKMEIIETAPHIWLPRRPEPKDIYITKDEADRLIRAAQTPHTKLFIILALATAARKTALLELKWDRVDFDRLQIQLTLDDEVRHVKKRAIVPINPMALVALREAKEGAQTDHVIEFGGRPVRSVRTSFDHAAEMADLDFVTPHVLRHSAAVWMAEAGHSMAEIAQFLGHSDSRITERVYAKFSPGYLQKAASALDLSSTRKLHAV